MQYMFFVTYIVSKSVVLSDEGKGNCSSTVPDTGTNLADGGYFCVL